MFLSGKEKRAREEELLHLRNILGTMGQSMSWIADNSESASVMLQDIGTIQEKVDRSLGRMAFAVNQIMQEEADRTEKEEGLRGRLAELIENCKQGEEAYGQCTARAREQQQMFEETRKRSGQLAEPLTELDEKSKKLSAILEESQSEIETMKERGRTMSVLALNAAIEAGRMDELGRNFVAAAEDVRSCAEDYRQAAGRVEEQLGRMKQELAETNEKLGRMKQELADHSAELENAGQGFGRYVEQLADQKMIGHAEGLTELSQDWQQLAEEASRQGNHCKQIVKDLKAVDEEYKQEQKLLERLESLQDQIMQAIKERRAWG